jgi:polar amino acid transport system substrate-binding protein
MRHWWLVLVAGLACATARAEPMVLRACVPDRAAPPFTYSYRQHGEMRTAGLAWRVLAELLPPERFALRIEVLPWARCLQAIEEGKQDLTVNATWNAQRAGQYQLTRPYFLSHVHFFWSRERYATPPVQSVADLQRMQVCGVLGHNYAQVGLEPTQVDTGSKDFESVFRKIAGGRCQVFAQSIEDLEGEQAMGATYLADPRIAHAPLPGVEPVRRCFLFSRADPRLAEAVAMLDAGLERLAGSGGLERLMHEETELLRLRFAAPR